MKELHFRFHDQRYVVNEQGHIKRPEVQDSFSGQWIFRGGAKHHMQNRPTVSLAQAFADPEKLNGCLGFDIDHGTHRMWGRQYNGKLPRITGAYVENVISREEVAAWNAQKQ